MNIATARVLEHPEYRADRRDRGEDRSNIGARDFGATTNEQDAIVKNIRQTLRGDARALRDTQRAEELLFEDFIPHEAIIGRH